MVHRNLTNKSFEKLIEEQMLNFEVDEHGYLTSYKHIG